MNSSPFEKAHNSFEMNGKVCSSKVLNCFQEANTTHVGIPIHTNTKLRTYITSEVVRPLLQNYPLMAIINLVVLVSHRLGCV